MFAVAAPRAWNNLLLSIRATVSADCFTINLKTFLYNSAFIPYHFSLFLSFTVLGALVVPLGHLRRPSLNFLWYDNYDDLSWPHWWP